MVASTVTFSGHSGVDFFLLHKQDQHSSENLLCDFSLVKVVVVVVVVVVVKTVVVVVVVVVVVAAAAIVV